MLQNRLGVADTVAELAKQRLEDFKLVLWVESMNSWLSWASSSLTLSPPSDMALSHRWCRGTLDQRLLYPLRAGNETQSQISPNSLFLR